MVNVNNSIVRRLNEMLGASIGRYKIGTYIQLIVPIWDVAKSFEMKLTGLTGTSTGWKSAWTCPEGFQLIIQALDIWRTGSTMEFTHIGIQRHGGSQNIPIAKMTAGSTGTFFVGGSAIAGAEQSLAPVIFRGGDQLMYKVSTLHAADTFSINATGDLLLVAGDVDECVVIT
jgi:hypothetical protein